MKNCVDTCKESSVKCENANCRYWINYGEDLNCCFVSIDKRGEMDLRTIGDIMGVSFVRIKQIQDAAMVKIHKALKVIQ